MANEYDSRLADTLTRMLETDGNLHRFYCWSAWRHLRAHVLAEFHGECYDCLQRSPARYTPAECVHHVREVEDFPGWALTEYIPDGQGGTMRQLVPLCHECHDLRHGRFKGRPRDNTCTAPLTAEWW